jgi:hypothetical protein
MGALKKFKDNYPKEKEKKPIKTDNSKDKQEIAIYISKIQEKLKNPTAQKKAADILSQLINKKK